MSEHELCEMVINGDPTVDGQSGARVLKDPVRCSNDAVEKVPVMGDHEMEEEYWLCEEHIREVGVDDDGE